MKKYFFLITSIMVFASSSLLATSITTTVFDEKNITLEEAKSLGLTPHLSSSKDKRGLYSFMVHRPKSVDGCKVQFATVELHINEKIVTSFIMTKTSLAKSDGSKIPSKKEFKDYFSADVNPAVIDSYAISVFCSGSRIFKFKVGADAL